MLLVLLQSNKLERHDITNQVKVKVRQRWKYWHNSRRTQHTQLLQVLATDKDGILFHFIISLSTRHFNAVIHLIQQLVLVHVIR
jgi:hypothetical protein